MDKHEILEKSREENRQVDERFKLIEQRRGLVAMSAAALAFALLFLWDFFHGKNVGGLQAVLFTGLAAMALCQARQLRLKSLLVFGLFIASFAVYGAVRYVMATM